MEEQTKQRDGGQGRPPAPQNQPPLAMSAPFGPYSDLIGSQSTFQGFWGPFPTTTNTGRFLGGPGSGQSGIGISPSSFSCSPGGGDGSLPTTATTATTATTSSHLSLPSTTTPVSGTSSPFVDVAATAAVLAPITTSESPNGPSVASSTYKALAPPSTDHARQGPGDVPRNPPPAGSSGRPSTKYDLPSAHPPSKLPAKGGSSTLPPPTATIITITATAGSSHPSLLAASVSASTNSTVPPSGSDRTIGPNNSRQNALSTGSPAFAPAQGGPGPGPGPGPGLQPLANTFNDRFGGGGASKPVVKMKRTGQNFPLSSPATASLHQRNSSYSPSRKVGPSPSVVTARKTSDLASTKDPRSISNERHPPAKASKPGREKEGSKTTTVGPLDKQNGTSSADLQPAHRFSMGNGPIGLLPTTVHAPRAESTNAKTTVRSSGHDSDDEIKYETATHATGLDDLLTEVPAENDLSSDDSDSDSEDDETVGRDPAGETSFRQLFRAPDQELSDGYDEGDSADDDATSVSSSEESSIANEPTVALPSANIQHQEVYPSTVLEMASPTRAYTTWPDKGALVKASPAIFPNGYSKCTIVKGLPWICAVRSCRQVYKTPAGLGNHFRASHKKAMLNDNMDGTLSLIGSYTRRNESGRYPPVVVSRRPLDPDEPTMPPPTVPAKTQKALVSLGKVKAVTSVLGDENVMMGDVDAASLEPQEPSSPHLAADPRSSEELWKYIRPFLQVHSSIPTVNWVRHVIQLPRVREIKWNQERVKEHPYKDSHARDITALIVQVTGVVAPVPCDHCVQGKGPFIGCIMISPEAPTEARAGVLSCANCYYHCGQSYCSHCSDAVERRERRARLGQKPESYNVKLLSDAARRNANTTTATTAQPQASLNSMPAALQASPRPNLRLYQPSEIKGIEMASSDRTYKVIKGKDGKMILMHGALIPERYDLDRTVPGCPWICPVRSCRLVFKRIINLGSHFVVKHRGNLLNDNSDGTLSEVGYYNKPLPGNDKCPAIIVSQRPLDKKEPPMEKARTPGRGTIEKEIKPKIVLKRSNALPSKQSGADTLSMTGNAKKLWDYMLPLLPKPLNSITHDLQIIRLFSLPRKRGIHWRTTWDTHRLEDDKKQIIGLLVYLTGEEHANIEKSCTNCRRGRGPFPACHVLPNDAPYEYHALVKGCANCHFMHDDEACSIKSSWQIRAGNKSREEAVAEWAGATGHATGAHANKRRRLSDSDIENEEPWTARRRSDRLLNGEDEDRTEPRKKKIVTLNLNPKEGKSTKSTTGSGVGVLRRTVSTGEPSKPTPSLSALVRAGQVQPDDLLEMEDWEIAPGRIRESGSERVNNIAFSKSYLETHQAVRVSADICFEVKTIKSGHSLQMEADPAKTRYCSLATGKLRVGVEDQPDFTIGPHGMFKIEPGLKAWVQNRLYVDSVLHIASHVDS